MLSEKAKSRAQQRFFGMVRAAQKGEMDNPSSEVLDAADSMKVSDVRKFAKTKHKGLPEKKKIEELAFLAAAGKVALAAGKGAIKQKAKQVVRQKAANVAMGEIPQPNRDQQEGIVNKLKKFGEYLAPTPGKGTSNEPSVAAGTRTPQSTHMFKHVPSMNRDGTTGQYGKKGSTAVVQGVRNVSKNVAKHVTPSAKTVAKAALPVAGAVGAGLAVSKGVDSLMKLGKKKKVNESKGTAELASLALRGKKRCAKCGSFTHVTGDCPKKDHPVTESNKYKGVLANPMKEAYRVLASSDGQEKPSQFSYKDEKTAKKYADSIKKGGGKATVTKESVLTRLGRKKKVEKKKPEKAMDAGARAKRLLQRKIHAKYVSGSQDLVPDDIRDHYEVIDEKKKGLDGKECWDGYKLAGTKKKGGKTVDNCVKVKEDYMSGQGEKIQKRTLAWMRKKGQKGAPGLDAMKAREAEHKARRGVKEDARLSMYQSGMTDASRVKGPVGKAVDKLKSTFKKKKRLDPLDRYRFQSGMTKEEVVVGEGKGYQPEIEHSKMGDAKKKADEKRESKLPPHLQGDAIGKMKKAFATEGKKRGLWDNIHAKRKRGGKPAKPGDKNYPKTLNVEGVELGELKLFGKKDSGAIFYNDPKGRRETLQKTGKDPGAINKPAVDKAVTNVKTNVTNKVKSVGNTVQKSIDTQTNRAGANIGNQISRKVKPAVSSGVADGIKQGATAVGKAALKGTAAVGAGLAVSKGVDSVMKGGKKKEVKEGVVDAIKKGNKRHKDAVEKKKIKNRKAVPYAALGASYQPEGELVDETYFDTNRRGISTKGGFVKQYNKPGKLSRASLNHERKSKNPELRMSKKELRTSMIDDANYEKKMGRSKPTPSNLKTALKKQSANEELSIVDKMLIEFAPTPLVLEKKKQPSVHDDYYDPMEDPYFDPHEAEATRGQSGRGTKGKMNVRKKYPVKEGKGGAAVTGTLGNIVGGTVGGAIGGPAGAAVGSVAGGALGASAAAKKGKKKRAAIGGALGSALGPIGSGVGGAIGA